MTADNLVYATNSMRSSVSSLKKKLSNIKIQVELFDSEIEKIEGKFEKIVTQADIYKSKLEREMGREVRRLERELDALRKQVTEGRSDSTPVPEQELNIASTIGILDTVLRLMSETAEDFRLMSQAFLFPAVFERVISGEDEAYILEEVPSSADIVIRQGREYVTWLRDKYDTHITDPDSWAESIDTVCDWWRNTALPLLYGNRDEQWDIDIPLTLTEMLSWRDVPGDRPLNFSAIFDAYEIYRNNKDAVYDRTGLRKFELQHFSFQ